MKRIPVTIPSITDLEIGYVNDAVRFGWGDKCYDYIYRFQDLFSNYLDVQFSLATSSCTGAIHLGLMAMGIKAGDEVILPDITWIASVEPVLYIGAKPVFVDIQEDSWCLDPSKLEAAITEKTTAIIVVHLYGNLADMRSIMEIAAKHDLKVLEDAAEGFGSLYNGRKAGSIGDVGCFSFHGTKTICTGEGGIVCTNDPLIFERAKILNDHGRDPKIGKTFWMEDFGYKYKMSNLQAAMGCAQIERANELVLQKRTVFHWYKEAFAQMEGTSLNVELDNTINSYWMPTLIFSKMLDVKRDELIEFLKMNGIDSRPFFYPLTSLPIFEDKPENIVSYSIYNRGINLPSYHSMVQEDVLTIVQVIRTYLSV